jgi:hypothetical protein
MKRAAVRTGDVDGFFARAKDAARRADVGKGFDGRVTLSFEDPERTVAVLSELQNLRSELLAGAASAPGQPAADDAYFQSLRSAVAQGLSSGEARSAGQVLDSLEAKYAAQIDARKAD